MANLAKALVALAVLAFLLAVVGNLFTGRVAGVTPEGWSRACSNLSLIAIALVLVFQERPREV